MRLASKAEIGLIKVAGFEPFSREIAQRHFSINHSVYLFHAQDPETPSEAERIEELDGYTSDQMMIVPSYYRVCSRAKD